MKRWTDRPREFADTWLGYAWVLMNYEEQIVVEMVEEKRVLVSDSGIKSADDLKKLRQHGVHIALVGEALLRQEDPGKALRELIGQR